jgi:hypothetical protein
MPFFILRACIQGLLFMCLCFCLARSSLCDDQVFIDIHISVDEPVLSQALAINAWAYSAIPGPTNFHLFNFQCVTICRRSCRFWNSTRSPCDVVSHSISCIQCCCVNRFSFSCGSPIQILLRNFIRQHQRDRHLRYASHWRTLLPSAHVGYGSQCNVS